MLKTLQNAFKVKDVRHRIFYVLMMLVVIRIGSQLPVPGVDGSYFKTWFESQTGDAFNFLDAFTGGSFSQMSIFALSITPYITSSIIMQLMTIIIPSLEEMQKDQDGREKMKEYTFYLSIVLAAIQSLAMGIGFYRGGYLASKNALGLVIVVVALVTGACVLIYLGEEITKHGVGNGVSMILLFNIISRLPQDFKTLYDTFMSGKSIVKAGLALIIIVAVILFMFVFVVYLQDAYIKIPVQNSSKVQGRRSVGSVGDYIPFKVNSANVIPVIFAGSLMSLPSLITTFAGKTPSGILGEIIKVLNQNNWFNMSAPVYSIGVIIYIVLVVAFAYFYTSIQYNPVEMANNLKANNGTVPGIRPGAPTADYIRKILSRITLIGAMFLAVIAMIPLIYGAASGMGQMSIGGTSIIIVVGVALETVKQLESQMMMRHYKGFLD